MRPIPGVKGIVPQMWSDFADVKAQFRRCDEMAQKPETAMVLQQVWSAALIMLATVTVTVSAQTGPDFSGRWVLATPRGQSLVFESGSHAGQLPEHGVWSERREVWTLDPDGHLRVVITTRSSTDGSTSVALVYRQS
jgi:hypothetical protein